MSVRLIDNSDEFLSEAAKAKLMALEAIGLKAEGYAKKELTIFPAVDTGRLRNSITHAIKGDDVYIGTNVDYGKWVELGTGIYASDGTGRKTPWVYKDDEGEELQNMLAATEYLDEETITERVFAILDCPDKKEEVMRRREKASV